MVKITKSVRNPQMIYKHFTNFLKTCKNFKNLRHCFLFRKDEFWFSLVPKKMFHLANGYVRRSINIYGMSWRVLSMCYSLMKQIKNTTRPKGYIWKYAVMLLVTFESFRVFNLLSTHTYCTAALGVTKVFGAAVLANNFFVIVTCPFGWPQDRGILQSATL